MIWPPLTGKSSADFAVAGAIAVMVTPACLRAADTAGLTTTSVLLPMTVARAARYLEVVGGLGGVLLAAVGVPAEVWPPAAPVGAELALEVLPPELLLPPEPPLQAATASPAVTSTAITSSREQRR